MCVCVYSREIMVSIGREEEIDDAEEGGMGWDPFAVAVALPPLGRVQVN